MFFCDGVLVAIGFERGSFWLFYSGYMGFGGVGEIRNWLVDRILLGSEVNI